MRALIHLSSSETSKKSELFGNMKNLREDERTDVENIKVVINSDAVEMTEKGSPSEEYLKKYMDQGADFLVCSNSVENREKVDAENLIEGLKLVESGIGTINLLQEKGYNYTKI